MFKPCKMCGSTKIRFSYRTGGRFNYAIGEMEAHNDIWCSCDECGYYPTENDDIIKENLTISKTFTEAQRKWNEAMKPTYYVSEMVEVLYNGYTFAGGMSIDKSKFAKELNSREVYNEFMYNVENAPRFEDVIVIDDREENNYGKE